MVTKTQKMRSLDIFGCFPPPPRRTRRQSSKIVPKSAHWMVLPPRPRDMKRKVTKTTYRTNQTASHQNWLENGRGPWPPLLLSRRAQYCARVGYRNNDITISVTGERDFNARSTANYSRASTVLFSRQLLAGVPPKSAREVDHGSQYSSVLLTNGNQRSTATTITIARRPTPVVRSTKDRPSLRRGTHSMPHATSICRRYSSHGIHCCLASSVLTPSVARSISIQHVPSQLLIGAANCNLTVSPRATHHHQPSSIGTVSQSPIAT